jgi:hypothetical protein
MRVDVRQIAVIGLQKRELQSTQRLIQLVDLVWRLSSNGEAIDNAANFDIKIEWDYRSVITMQDRLDIPGKQMCSNVLWQYHLIGFERNGCEVWG